MNGPAKLLTKPVLEDLATQAQASARRRSHLLWHPEPEDQVQRLVIALEPGTYIRPHCHPEQWELLMMIAGEVELLGFDADGTFTQRLLLVAGGDCVGIELPPGHWHSLQVTSRASLLEIKPGPLRPATFASWAPAEGDAAVPALQAWLATDAVGERCPRPGSDD